MVRAVPLPVSSTTEELVAVPQVVMKTARLAATVLAVSLLTFFFTTRLPGDATLTALGAGGADEATRQQLREKLGLDEPFWHRFVEWFGSVLTGDLGNSYQTGEGVTGMLGQAFPVTIEIIVLTIAVSLLVSIPLGIVEAHFRNRFADRAAGGVTFVILATPPFVMGLLLILVFAVTLQVVPASGWVPISEDLGGNLSSVVLPVAALSLTQIAVFSRILRGDLISTLDQDFIALARAKGLSTSRVMLVHALRPSSFSLVTVVGLHIGLLLGGTVVVEQVFALPGIGSLLIDAVNSRDLVIVQAIALLAAVGFVVINFIVDIVYTRLDPRLRNG